MRISDSAHAIESLAVRKIDRAWVERTVLAPQTVEPAPNHPERLRAYRAVPERDGRVLRVIYERGDAEVVVVTAFLARGWSRRRGR